MILFARAALYVGQARHLSHAPLPLGETRFCCCCYSFVHSLIPYLINTYRVYIVSTMFTQCFALKKTDMFISDLGELNVLVNLLLGAVTGKPRNLRGANAVQGYFLLL